MGNNWQSQPRASNGQFSSNGNTKENASIQNKRIQLANKSQLLKNIPLLQFNRKNWKSVITNAMNTLENTLKNQNIVCSCLNKQVTDCNKTHIYLKNRKVRDWQSLKNHASFIPFFIPVLQNGIVDRKQDRLLKTGELTSEVVCRADVNINGSLQRIGVSVVVVHNFNNISLKAISVFKIDDKMHLIKSCSRKAPKGLSDFHGNVHKTSSSVCAFNNSILTEKKEKSTSEVKTNMKKNVELTDIYLTIDNITDTNKSLKVKKIENYFRNILKYKNLDKAKNTISKSFQEKDLEKSNNRDVKKYENMYIQLSKFNLLEYERLQKALRHIGFSLREPTKKINGETFCYKSQEDLTNIFAKELTEKTRSVYDFIADYFDLPNKSIVTKSVLIHKGKIIYSPETGNPLTTQDFKKFVEVLEKFLNRNYKGIGEKIVLSSEVLGRLLDRLSKTQSLETLKKQALEDLKIGSKKIDWIAEDIKQLKNIFGESITRQEAARVQIACNSAAQKIASVTDSMKNSIKQIILDGVKNKESKSKVSQRLFDKCASINRDLNRIADTEIQNNTNNAYIHEEVYKANENEKVYFKRIEIIDEFTCKKCKALNGTIALWSNYPIEEENIKDEYATIAIWDGKNDFEYNAPNGALHPYCRGIWVRAYPEYELK